MSGVFIVGARGFSGATGGVHRKSHFGVAGEDVAGCFICGPDFPPVGMISLVTLGGLRHGK